MIQILYLFFGALALVAAALAVTRKNPVTSAVLLVLMFFSLAAGYALLEAWFVGAIQILVYAGAIMVLFLFVIMLLDLRTQMLETKASPRFRFFGAVGGLLFLVAGTIALRDAQERGLLARPLQTLPSEAAALAEAPGATTLADLPLDAGADAIAGEMFTRWVLAFEATSVLLLGAILGAVVLTKRRLA